MMFMRLTTSQADMRRKNAMEVSSSGMVPIIVEML